MPNCDGCTLCCLLFPVPDMDIDVAEECPCRNPGTGCSMYCERPPDCVFASCMYLQSENITKDLKPSTCGVIFEKVTDAIIIATKLKETVVNEVVTKQIQLFANEGISTILNSLEEKPIVYAAPGASRAEVNRIIGERWLHTQPI
jgi:hypothetical protein